MRVFFVGNVIFSKKTLLKLIKLKTEIVGIATKSKSSFNADQYDLSEIADKHHIPYKYVRDINAPHILDWITSTKPDIIFVFGWSSLIKKPLLDIPPMGVLGFHPAELPMNRGRHPIIWALILGLTNTASTFFFMDEGADSGDILSQKKVPISDIDDAENLYSKIISLALTQIEEFIPHLQSNNYTKIAQDHSKANYWRKRGCLDGKIDFRMSSKSIYNLVRGLTKPYIGAHLIYEGKEVKIWKVNEIQFDKKNEEPGKILDVYDEKILVKTGDGAIEIESHQFKYLPQKNTYL